jgi:hypothetical protein
VFDLCLDIDPMSNTSALRLGDWKLIQGKQQYSGWIEPPAVDRSFRDVEADANGTKAKRKYNELN